MAVIRQGASDDWVELVLAQAEGAKTRRDAEAMVEVIKGLRQVCTRGQAESCGEMPVLLAASRRVEPQDRWQQDGVECPVME